LIERIRLYARDSLAYTRATQFVHNIVRWI